MKKISIINLFGSKSSGNINFEAVHEITYFLKCNYKNQLSQHGLPIDFTENSISELIKKVRQSNALIFLLDQYSAEKFFFGLGFGSGFNIVGDENRPILYFSVDDCSYDLEDFHGLSINASDFKTLSCRDSILHYLNEKNIEFWQCYSNFLMHKINLDLGIDLELKDRDSIINEIKKEGIEHPNEIPVFKIGIQAVKYFTKNYSTFQSQLNNYFINNPKARIKHLSLTKTIKIFLASSEELRKDRDDFDLYFRQQNDHLMEEKGLYLKIVRWENFLDAMSETRLQDEYNKEVKDCDIFISLFFTKTGKYTKEEFDVAHKQFSMTSKPQIFTFFKDELIKPSLLKEYHTVEDFKKKLGDLGHFYTSYDNIEHLKRQFRDQLDKLLRAGKV